MSHEIMPSPFTWATGIEDTFIPQTRPGMRSLDEYELTQHYQVWRSDFELVAETGVQAVRWGIPWYRVQPAAKVWDWEWTDKALDFLVNGLGITPILDLMHYGTPLWLDNSFINASYPERVAEYAAAVAARYKSLVRFYTPLNEPMVNAEMCGSKAEWPPYLNGDDGYVKLTLSLAKGIILTTQAIKAEQPEAVTVQVEALWHTFTRDASLEAHTASNNARQFLCFDLTTGRVNEGHTLVDYLRTHGAAGADLEWFRSHPVTFDLFGANFYPWSYSELKRRRDGSPQHITGKTHGDRTGIVIREAYQRYRMPIMITETSAIGSIEARARWMDETLDAVATLRSEGIPVVGYTWFPLFTMVDWAYRKGRRPLNDYLIHLGLYDSTLDSDDTQSRRRTPLVERYQQHMARPMPAVKNC